MNREDVCVWQVVNGALDTKMSWFACFIHRSLWLLFPRIFMMQSVISCLISLLRNEPILKPVVMPSDEVIHQKQHNSLFSQVTASLTIKEEAVWIISVCVRWQAAGGTHSRLYHFTSSFLLKLSLKSSDMQSYTNTPLLFCGSIGSMISCVSELIKRSCLEYPCLDQFYFSPGLGNYFLSLTFVTLPQSSWAIFSCYCFLLIFSCQVL